MLINQPITFLGFTVEVLKDVENSQALKIKKGTKGTKGARMQLKERGQSEALCNAVQKSIDRDNKVLQVKNEIAALKKRSKDRRAQFAAKRKGLQF